VRRKWQRVLKSTLLQNAGWMMAGQVASLLFQALYFVVLARLLGAVQYGVFVGAFSFTSLLANYSTLGSGTVFLRYVSGNRSAFAPYWGNILLLAFGIGGALSVVLHWLAPHLLNPASASLVLLAGIANCLCQPLTMEIGRIFQAFEQLRITAALTVLTSFMRALAAVAMLLLLHHASAWQWAVASTIVSVLAAAAAALTVTVRFGWPTLSKKIITDHGLEGFGYSFAASTSSVYNDIDKTMLSHYGMNSANGIYAMAYRVVDIATMPVTSIQAAALSQFFQLGRSGLKATRELSNRLLRRALPLSLLSAVAMFATAPLIPRIFGQGFAESATALRWLCLIPVFRSMHLMTGCALTGAGKQNYRTLAQITAAAFNFGLNLWLIPNYGWRGAAWSSLATDAALGVLNWQILQVLTKKSITHEFIPAS
jgi:O-antigen/teichoic acid export membrane protein